MFREAQFSIHPDDSQHSRNGGKGSLILSEDPLHAQGLSSESGHRFWSGVFFNDGRGRKAIVTFHVFLKDRQAEELSKMLQDIFPNPGVSPYTDLPGLLQRIQALPSFPRGYGELEPFYPFLADRMTLRPSVAVDSITELNAAVKAKVEALQAAGAFANAKAAIARAKGDTFKILGALFINLDTINKEAISKMEAAIAEAMSIAKAKTEARIEARHRALMAMGETKSSAAVVMAGAQSCLAAQAEWGAAQAEATAAEDEAKGLAVQWRTAMIAVLAAQTEGAQPTAAAEGARTLPLESYEVNGVRFPKLPLLSAHLSPESDLEEGFPNILQISPMARGILPGEFQAKLAKYGIADDSLRIFLVSQNFSWEHGTNPSLLVPLDRGSKLLEAGLFCSDSTQVHFEGHSPNEFVTNLPRILGLENCSVGQSLWTVVFYRGNDGKPRCDAVLNWILEEAKERELGQLLREMSLREGVPSPTTLFQRIGALPSFRGQGGHVQKAMPFIPYIDWSATQSLYP